MMALKTAQPIHHCREKLTIEAPYFFMGWAQSLRRSVGSGNYRGNLCWLLGQSSGKRSVCQSYEPDF